VRLRSKRGAWFAFALLVLGGIASGTWSLTRSPPAPNAVLVHIEGCDEGCREAIFAYAERLLGEHGFEAVPDVERLFPADLNRVLTTARREGASHALFLSLHAVESREGAGGADRVQVLAEVMLDVATADGETMRVSRQLSLEGEDEIHALKLAGDAVLDGAIDRVAGFLVESSAVEAFLASEPTPRELETRERLERARGGVEALEAAQSDFEQRCERARETAEATEGLELRCQLRTNAPLALCPSENPVAVLETGVVVHAGTRTPRFRLGRRADVERSPETFDRLLHWDPLARAYYMAHAPRMRPDADALSPHWSVHVELALEPSGGVIGSALVLTGGTPRREGVVLLRTEPPVRIGLPHLAPDGRSVTFTRQEHEHAAPELMWMPARADAIPEPVTAFGAFGSFLERPLLAASESESGAEVPPESEAPVPEADALLFVTVAGAQGAEAVADAPEEEGDRSEEQQLFDDLLAPNAEERATLDLPQLTHLAVMRIGPGGPSLVARIGGVERPVQAVLGATAEGVVVASAGRPFGCTVGVVDWDTWEPRWVDVAGCLRSGSVAPGPRGDAIYGTMRVAEVSDPVVGDAEVVRVDLQDGRITQLTHDGVEDTKVIAGVSDGAVRLAIQRRPPTTYARFAPAYACTALAPTEPGQPFTPRPPPPDQSEDAEPEQPDQGEAAEAGESVTPRPPRAIPPPPDEGEAADPP